MTEPTQDVDPCPGAARVGDLMAWQHPYAVTCAGCERIGLRFAWWVAGSHRCGRCRARMLEAES